MRKEYRTFTKHSPLHFDTIHREITYDNNGNIVDVQDRNLSREFRIEQRELNKIQRNKEMKVKRDVAEKQWRNMPLDQKIWVYIGYILIVLIFIGPIILSWFIN